MVPSSRRSIVRLESREAAGLTPPSERRRRLVVAPGFRRGTALDRGWISGARVGTAVAVGEECLMRKTAELEAR